MTDVQWEAPRAKATTSRYDYFYAALRARPGEWAVYPGSGSSVHTQAARRPGFEAETRYEGDTIIGFMRYVGGDGNER